MKIGFVIDDGLDKPDGVQQYVLTLGAWYSQNGHEVRYLAGETQRTDLAGVYSMANNIKIRFNGNVLTNPLPVSHKKIKKILNDEQFDVLHVQTPHHPFFSARVVKDASPQTVVVGTFHILPYGLINRLGTGLLGVWLRRNFKRFDAVIAVSQPAAVFAKQAFRINCQVIPNSVDTTQFTPATSSRSDKSLRLLFVGRLVHRKGCQQILKALSILRQSDSLPPNLVVDICGDGPLRSQLEKFVIDNDLQSVVNFHGFITHEQKIKFMQQADMAVFPSLSGESFGIVLIEAMAAGSGVVLAGNNLGYASVLGALDGSMIDVRNPDVMAKQLQAMFSDKEKRHALHALQQAHVKQFDTAVVAAQLLKLYTTCKTARQQ